MKRLKRLIQGREPPPVAGAGEDSFYDITDEGLARIKAVFAKQKAQARKAAEQQRSSS